jgi:hypothetical protein
MRLVFAALLAFAFVGCTSTTSTETTVTNPDGSTTTTRIETKTQNGETKSRKTETTVRNGVTTKIVYEKKGEEWVTVE